MARPITWQQVAAPDFGDANRLMQQGAQNVQAGIGGLQDAAQNQSTEIADRNVASLAQDIMGAGDGLEGLQNLSTMEQGLSNIDTTAIGGTENLGKISSMLMGRKGQLEAQATDQYNDLLVEASSTNNWSALKEFEPVFAKYVNNSAPQIEKATNVMATQEATRLINSMNTGELKPEDVLKNTDSNLINRPEFAAVFEVASNKINNAKAGQLLKQVPTMISAVTSGGKNPTQVMSEFFGNMKDEELARNMPMISGVMNQVQDAYTKSLNLNPNETLMVESWKSQINASDEIFEQEMEVAKNAVARKYGTDPIAVTAYEQYKDSNLRISDVIRNKLGSEMSEGTLIDALEIVNQTDLKNISPAAIAYAIDMHPEIGNEIITKTASFKAKVEAAQKEIDAGRNAYNELDTFLLSEKKAFLDYKRQANQQLFNNSNGLVQARRNNRQPTIEPISSYSSVGLQNIINDLTKPTTRPVEPKNTKRPTPSEAFNNYTGEPANLSGMQQLNDLFVPRT